MRVLYMLGIFIFLITAGCREDGEDFPSGVYLQQVIYHQNVDQIRTYHYNNQGLLSLREYHFNGKLIEKFSYLYSDGFISRIEYYGIRNNYDMTLYPGEHLVYEYESGKIVKSALIPGGNTVVYLYNDKGQVTKTSLSSQEYTTYEYDDKGNIIKSLVYKGDTLYWKFFCWYDNMKNPFYQVDPVHDNFSSLDLVNYKCQNNVLRSVFINEKQDTISQSEFIYTYDSNRLPVKSYELYTSEINGYFRDSLNTKLYIYENR